MRGQSRIRAVARRQNWLITFAQLRALGFSRSAIDRMVRAGRLFRVHRERHGVPVTTAEFTILFLAGTMYSDRHFRRVVHEALVRGVTSLSGLLAEVARAPPRVAT